MARNVYTKQAVAGTSMRRFTATPIIRCLYLKPG